MPLEVADFSELAETYAQRHPRDILALAFELFSPSVGISFSGAEDVVLVDLASKLGAPFRVFSLDTGRLHPETLRFLDQVRERYEIPVEVFFPRPEAVEKMVREKGLFSFYKDGHQECCGVRKVEPLRRALGTLSAWVTGQRRDQSPSTRAEVPVVQADSTFSTPGLIGVPNRFGTTSAKMTSRITRCTSGDSSPSDANLARKPFCPASTSVKAVGGGKRPPRKSAACTQETSCPKSSDSWRARLRTPTNGARQASRALLLRLEF